MKRNSMFILSAFILFSAFSCGTNGSKTTSTDITEKKVIVQVPQFDADSAYKYIQAQVDFGPRTPNSKGHVACGDYLAAKLAEHGAKVISQNAELPAYDGTLLKARNIIGSFKPESKKRIALFAHWDTRPWADNDPNEKNHHTPILGANDGASGVGVLLEIARQINQQQPELGIDIIFLDAEDYGAPQFYTGEHREDQWCLGAQYWARTPHVDGYNARFGILLDMVGGKDATFFKEVYSEKYAKGINKKVWKKANDAGYGRYFINEVGGQITDDHLFINRLAGIPTIDIIPNDENCELSSFGPTWHTVNDNMDAIDRSTLKAVGQTVLEVIYNEKKLFIMSINELQDEVVAEFSDFDDWMDRYQLLIDLGNEQEPLDEKYKTEQNLIEGCQSRVWLQADEVDGKIIFKAESDALIVKGIIALLIKVVSGHTPDEILNSELYFIDRIGLKDHLSPTRSNGLLSMVKQMRMYALAFKAKEAKG